MHPQDPVLPGRHLHLAHPLRPVRHWFHWCRWFPLHPVHRLRHRRRWCQRPLADLGLHLDRRHLVHHRVRFDQRYHHDQSVLADLGHLGRHLHLVHPQDPVLPGRHLHLAHPVRRRCRHRQDPWHRSRPAGLVPQLRHWCRWFPLHPGHHLYRWFQRPLADLGHLGHHLHPQDPVLPGRRLHPALPVRRRCRHRQDPWHHSRPAGLVPQLRHRFRSIQRLLADLGRPLDPVRLPVLQDPPTRLPQSAPVAPFDRQRRLDPVRPVAPAGRLLRQDRAVRLGHAPYAPRSIQFQAQS